MALHPENEETVAMGAPPSSTPRPVAANGALPRFAPGTLLARRYRIVSKLGRGGMGEVFRADDIVLGQTVALKFLPEAAHRNENLLARFYDEVRIARQISHANVCRVYDIGEIEGQPYLSMEYIDGEDLSSLLRRIGRLPGDKAAEMARKMCAGLAAAHAQGVLHRDIKPGNIMIDGRGEPRITDFGLAALGKIEGNEIRNGTPAYMAPEQLEGREVSAQSDIYALGLVFHEMFTGKPAHEAETVAELTKLRRDSAITNTSTAHDLDPAVDRAIQSCLQPDPKQRPKSALDLARMLPGGDPLAAALAAGQTPSPEMVAASGSTEGIRPWVAAAAVIAVIIGLVVSLQLNARFQIAGMVYLERPEVLESKAREMIRSLGYTDAPADSVLDYEFNSRHRGYQDRKFLGQREAWARELQSEPIPFLLHYRQSTEPMVARVIGSEGEIQRNDPPLLTPGMINADIGMDGRLYYLLAVPPEKQVLKPETKYDWSPLFAAAKLDPAAFQGTPPEWTPVVATDQRAAWTGIYPTNNEKVVIEAGAFQGKPVYFRVVWPWITPDRTTVSSALVDRRSLAQNVFAGVSLLVIIAAVIFARYNAKAGRVDFNGATRLAIFMFAVSMIQWLSKSHHTSSSGERGLWDAALKDAITDGFYAWVLYLALEPWVRRYWPQVMVTWTRTMSGRWRDPLVGRDILIGVLAGVIGTVFVLLIIQVDAFTTGDFRIDQLLGTSRVVEVLAGALQGSVGVVLLYLMMLLLLRLALKRTWLAGVAFVALWCVYRGMGSGADQWWVAALFFAPLTALFMVTLVRYGFFAAVVAAFVIDSSVDMMMTTDITAWYGQSTLLMVLLWIGLTGWGARLALGNRNLLDSAMAKQAL